ncbi:MAG: hypothetical protein KF773_25460 [Deltaproteobacteria bacterium]|nr:hypothetical protein [Deltaproteobacteria bacterium]
MMKLLSLSPATLSILLLSACGGSGAKPANVGNHKTDPSGLPALYAGLFETGKSWKLPAEYVTSMDGQTSSAKGTMTCHVEEARAITGGKTARLACDPDGVEAPDSPAGTYVGTPAGLWRVDDAFDGDATKLDATKMLLAAAPKEGKVETKDTENPDHGSAVIVKAHAGGWCASSGSWGGDEGGWTLCLRDGAVIGGAGFWAGGSTRDLYFGDVPRN